MKSIFKGWRQKPALTKGCSCCGTLGVTGHRAGRTRCYTCYIASCAIDGSKPRKGCPRLRPQEQQRL